MKSNDLELITVNEAAALLKTCRQQIYKLINQDQLKGFKSDTNKYLIFRSSLERYVESCYNQYATRTTAKEGYA